MVLSSPRCSILCYKTLWFYHRIVVVYMFYKTLWFYHRIVVVYMFYKTLWFYHRIVVVYMFYKTLWFYHRIVVVYMFYKTLWFYHRIVIVYTWELSKCFDIVPGINDRFTAYPLTLVFLREKNKGKTAAYSEAKVGIFVPFDAL